LFHLFEGKNFFFHLILTGYRNCFIRSRHKYKNKRLTPTSKPFIIFETQFAFRHEPKRLEKMKVEPLANLRSTGTAVGNDLDD
jgi:hypothetical protein